MNKFSFDATAMAWIYLGLSAVSEIIWNISAKYTVGFTKFYPSAVLVLMTLSVAYFSARALETLPVGIAYAIWAGASNVGIVLLGVFLFREELSCKGIFFVTLITIGVVGLQMVSGEK